MELDKKVREFPLPDIPPVKDSISLSFESFVLSHIKETGELIPPHFTRRLS